MSNISTLFPGAMGPEGFVSCFDHLIPESCLRRKLILKGGPGVGKSTFMRRLHATLCGDDSASTLYFCSGDPDSLDAVSIPDKGLLVLDGTAPHIIDPACPGARDSIINLGECLDEASMRPRFQHIRSCMSDHAAASRRARAFLRAAHALEQEAHAVVSACIDASRLTQINRALSAAVFAAAAERKDSPASRPVITDAVTPKGEMCLLSESANTRVIRLAHHAAMDLTPVLRNLSHAALASGFDVEEHINPLFPGALMHLTIPALHTLVTTSDRLPAEQIFDFSSCLPTGSLLRHECALEQLLACVCMNRRHAVSALAQAKQIHDELESFYVPSMDFGRWQELYDRTLNSLQN